MNLQGSKVLITGGAGLIGSHIADLLVHEGAREIVILDNFTRGRMANLAWACANGPVTVIEGDIGDTDLLASVVTGVDVLFHQAAIRITQCAQEPRLAVQVLVNGTFNVMEAAVNAGVAKVVAASTASIYGLADQFPTPETQHPYNNRTLYGAAKVFDEALLRSFNDMYKLQYVALRYFNVYGPRMDIYGYYTEVLVRWMERIVNGQPPLIFGDGLQTMDFIYVTDIARANILAAKAGADDDVFNVASGVESSLNDLAYALLRVMGSDLKPEYGPERKVNAVTRRLADTSRAAKHLGFKAEVDLENGLRQLVEWWQAERAATALEAQP